MVRANAAQSMARKPRLEYEGACYHVINRGNYRRPIFGTKESPVRFQAYPVRIPGMTLSGRAPRTV
jgi:hypothetical protein